MSIIQPVKPDLTTQIGRVRHLRDVMVRIQAEGKRYDHSKYAECGTPCCALGHYCCDSDAIEAGWGLDHVEYPVFNGDVIYYRSTDNWFGLHFHEKVFSGVAYAPTNTEDVRPEHVIARIDEILAGMEAA